MPSRLNNPSLAPAFGRRSPAGFTAVEIAMVATVIAIIALLILPIFRQRTEEARRVAALDELSSIAKAMLLIEADIGIQVRLNDLDNGDELGNVTNDNVGTAPPIAAWNGTLESDVAKSRDTVVANWLGPYAAFERFVYMTNSLAVPTLDPFFYTENGGPIYHVTGARAFSGNTSGGTSITDTDVAPFPSDPIGLADRFPVDPWGQPYLFFGKGTIEYVGGGTAESVFNTSVVYSMGPDGFPGENNPGAPLTFYHRETGILGTGDDLQYRF
jgi:type II secretory pathway pseudopilin PulG